MTEDIILALKSIEAKLEFLQEYPQSGISFFHGYFHYLLGLPQDLDTVNPFSSPVFEKFEGEQQAILKEWWSLLQQAAEADKVVLPKGVWAALSSQEDYETLYQSALKNWGDGFVAAEEIYGAAWDDWLEEFGGDEGEDEEEMPEDTLDVLFLFLSFWSDREWTFDQWDKVWKRVLELDWATFNKDNQEGFVNSIQDWFEFGKMGREASEKEES